MHHVFHWTVAAHSFELSSHWTKLSFLKKFFFQKIITQVAVKTVICLHLASCIGLFVCLCFTFRWGAKTWSAMISKCFDLEKCLFFVWDCFCHLSVLKTSENCLFTALQTKTSKKQIFFVSCVVHCVGCGPLLGAASTTWQLTEIQFDFPSSLSCPSGSAWNQSSTSSKLKNAPDVCCLQWHFSIMQMQSDQTFKSSFCDWQWFTALAVFLPFQTQGLFHSLKTWNECCRCHVRQVLFDIPENRFAIQNLNTRKHAKLQCHDHPNLWIFLPLSGGMQVFSMMWLLCLVSMVWDNVFVCSSLAGCKCFPWWRVSALLLQNKVQSCGELIRDSKTLWEMANMRESVTARIHPQSENNQQ